MPQLVVCTINIIFDTSTSINDASRRVNDDFRVMLQIVASLTDYSIGGIYDCKCRPQHNAGKLASLQAGKLESWQAGKPRFPGENIN
jgi:hypothetical protein